MYRLSQNGMGMIGVLVTAALMGIVMMASITMLKSQNKATRHIASLGGVNELNNRLDLFLSTPKSPNWGTASFSDAGVSPVILTATGAGVYSVSIDTFKFPNGTVAVTSGSDPGQAGMLQPHRVASMVFSALQGEGPSGSGFMFPFEMVITFSSPSGPPPQPLRKAMAIFTDANYKVIGASARGAFSSTAHGSFFRSSPMGPLQYHAWNNVGFDGELSKSPNIIHNTLTNSHLVQVSDPGIYQVTYGANFSHVNVSGSGFGRLVVRQASGTLVEIPGTRGSDFAPAGHVSFTTVVSLNAQDAVYLQVGSNAQTLSIMLDWNEFNGGGWYPPPMELGGPNSVASLTIVRLP